MESFEEQIQATIERIQECTPQREEPEEYKGQYLHGTPEEREQQRQQIDEYHRQYHREHIRRTSERLLGKRLAAITWENIEETAANRRAIEVVKNWVGHPVDNLIIVGPIGSGKTCIMACACRHLLHKGWDESLVLSTMFQEEDSKTVDWLSAPDWIATVKRGYSDEAASCDAQSMENQAASAGILFLDDLGKVQPGANGVGWLEEQFYRIIEKRYRNARPTVVTTEWNRDALGERVGHSVVSRLMDHALIAGMDAHEWRKPQ
jgi:DNA replication protein DnaC